ncbi:MAG: lipocalin-like domain-containing protein [Pseudomonadota bacterium]|nr:lipocalin-like domain-containing protein [Pseudomonadota bacterium]
MFRTFGRNRVVCLFTLSLSLALFSADCVSAWDKALKLRHFAFPRDHGSHPQFKTEWWYVTGQLATDKGREFGFQFTIFRQGIQENLPQNSINSNPWQVRDLFILHCALSDIENQRFFSHQEISRAGPGLAGARENSLETWLKGSRIALNEKKQIIELTVKSPDYELTLELQPAYPPILNGNRGLSAKGPEPGQASYYYSWPRLAAEGTLKLSGESFIVKGLSWLDREFATNQLGPEQAGWDWFALHFDDGSALMLYRMRLKDGGQDASSSGTWIFSDGSSRHLTNRDFKLDPGKVWNSPESGADYPVNWEIKLNKPTPMKFTISPLILNQEMNTANTVLANYWEGAVKVEGFAGTKRKLDGRGYLEMTGYDQILKALQKREKNF